MTMQDKVWSDFSSLPPEAQREAADFIAFLRQRYGRPTSKPRQTLDWESEPFVGMWHDREEMQDSTAWVRRTRQREWSEPLG
jgi:hypothetical protein